ncbi:MAG: ATP-dependent helicase HrpA [Candidatus Azotimanducaceae bacterium]|jgi:ATP-dependent helicase HrpA
MIKDRFRLQQKLKGRRSKNDKDNSKQGSLLTKSIALAEKRLAQLPKPTFPENLPVSQRLKELQTAISENQVIIVAGETGSGKTTQLPKICLSLGRGVYGAIGHTQPRRVAARTVAHRIAEELNVSLGKSVGYQVRFTDQSTEESHIKVMTDGILLAETRTDKLLEKYDTIIIDEAHERSLNIDFLMGYLKQILPRRPDLKVIVTSATIDVERFSQHFNNAPVVEVSGRTFPVDVHYRAAESREKDRDSDEVLNQGILDTLREIEHLERGAKSAGDVLVFLAGEREIRDVAHEIRKSDLKSVEVLPLYSRLSIAEQNRVFQKHTARRVVLTTNVAETSLTVPGIRYVIDPGFARISRYSVRSKVQQLPIEPISQASANQRKGRCGRVSHGICFRLYSEEDFLSRPEFTTPEILRTNLGAVILQMLNLKLGNINQFPFIERPEQRQINDGYQLLFELQAVDERKNISRIGRDMARFPIDLKLARMLLAAGKSNCLNEVLIVVSAMAAQDPRERPHEKQQAADQKHREHWHEQSDFLAFVNLWKFYEEQRQALNQNQLRKFCKSNFLSYMRMREWRENHRQLVILSREMKLKENTTAAEYETVHQALLAGLLGSIGEKTSESEYLGARNRKHFIFPGSSQFKRKPRWIVSAELVETTRLFARTVAQIDNSWIEPLALHLVKRHHQQAHYDVKRSQVMAYEEVMLYGVTIVKKRLVDYGSIDSDKARHLFIQEGLVERNLNSKAGFYRHNCRLIDDIEKLESKSRRRDILVDNHTLFRFYDERIPAGISSFIQLDEWRKKIEIEQPKLLFLQRDELMQQQPAISSMEFPDELALADTRLKIKYHFDPQHEDDGVNLNVPVSLLREVSSEQLDWLIPGLLKEKSLALMKSLPKSIRKNFVPAPDYLEKVLPLLEYDGRALTIVLAEKLFKVSGVKVEPSAFETSLLSQHLRMNIKVIGEKGKVLGGGRDLAELQKEYAQQAATVFRQRASHDLEISGAVSWVFGSIPEAVDLAQGKISMKGYPAIVDHIDAVSLEILDSHTQAQKLSAYGILRLTMLALKDQKKYIEKNIPGFEKFALFYATRGPRKELLDALVTAIFRFVFIENKPEVRNEAMFNERLSEKTYLIDMMNRVAGLISQILKLTLDIEQRLADGGSNTTQFAFQDMRVQLNELLGQDFLGSISLAWLEQFPRYLQAIQHRLEKIGQAMDKDAASTETVARYWSMYRSHIAQDSEIALRSAEAIEFRWMIEELRVSLFAQRLGTKMPISEKRIQRAWDKLA